MTFADVPWHRRSATVSMFIVIGFCLFPPLLIAACVICLTGDVCRDRRRSDGSLSRWSRGNKIAAVLIMPVQVTLLASRAGGDAGAVITVAGLGLWLAAVVWAAVRAVRAGDAGSGSVPPGVPVVPLTDTPSPGRPPEGGQDMAGESYWIVVDGAARGPYQPDTLRRMLLDGYVSPGVLVRTNGGDARPLGELVVIGSSPKPTVLAAGGPRASASVKWLAGLLLLTAGSVAAWRQMAGPAGNPSPAPPAPAASPGREPDGDPPPAGASLSVDTSRFVASRHGARVYYADGLRDEAEGFDKFLWNEGVFTGDVGGQEVWLGREGARLVLAWQVVHAGRHPPDWPERCRMVACQMAASLCPGRAFDLVSCDRDWRITGRAPVEPSHEIVVSPRERIFSEKDRAPGERVAGRLRELGFFNGGDAERVVVLLREPGRRILCFSLHAETVGEDVAAECAAWREVLQREADPGEEFVIRCLPDSNRGRRDFTAKTAVSPKTP